MKELIKKYNSRVVKYRDLPRHFQKALALYHSIDGDLWEFPNDRWQNHPVFNKDNPTDADRDNQDRYIINVMVRNINVHYVKKYGNYRIGVVEIPTLVLAQKVIDAGYPFPEVNSIDKYRIWARKWSGAAKHPQEESWPVILDLENGDVMSDGWHRFHCYFLRKDRTIPCLYYI
jgi:hypothetical protein